MDPRGELEKEPTNIYTLSSSFQKPVLVATIQTGSDVPRRLACFGPSEVWISGIDDVIEGWNIEGEFSVTDIFQTGSGRRPTDLTVNLKGRLVYSDHYQRKIFKRKNGHVKEVICFRKWRPSGICYTSKGELLIGMSNKSYTEKLIRRYSGRKNLQEIHFDNNGNPLFKPGDLAIFVEENKNTDICVSDCQAKCVLVFDKSGNVRFKYSGSHVMAEFNPGCLATDSLCNIFMVDTGNDLIHILDKCGQLLGFIDDACGMTGSTGIAVDSENRVWVTECHTSKIKVIKYT
ncbi:uncharacterized protein LOC133194894 [Saccostrea echinata]|uniref:uncharacterized protein LOC133194894 n=1 Tax=Saccostrea echinata TaxID=191078 RepID=UPI002A7F8B1D|nr:uncharacterized protein LOC133194894 [Saccostrea echinata]